MALITKGKKMIVKDEVLQLDRQEIEFLLNIIENSMIPGKYINLGNNVIQKLQNQFEIFDRTQSELKSALSNYQTKKKSPKPKPQIQKKGDEVWIEEK